jgi:hypothetical protein
VFAGPRAVPYLASICFFLFYVASSRYLITFTEKPALSNNGS